jgi:hypothetical protein
MARHGDLKASDADREQVAERLRQAAAEGRLLAHELEQRLATALRARTYGELDGVVADLPGAKPARRRVKVSPLTVAAMALAAVVVAALALAALAIAGALWVLWVLVGWAFFGHRGRAGRHWACANRRGRMTQANRRAVGSFTPWL